MGWEAWRRVPEAGACDFCLMLASRGAVYRSRKTASRDVHRLKRSHRVCRCGVELETSFDRRNDIRVDPDDAERRVTFFNEQTRRDYHYDLSDYRRLGVDDVPKLPEVPAPRPPVADTIPDAYRIGRDVHVPRDSELPYGVDGADVRPQFNPDRPLEFYGDALTIVGDSPNVRQALADIESLPRGVHEVLRDHLLGTDQGGIYIGDVDGIPQLDDLGHLAKEHPRGWSPNSTWEQVGGVYSPRRRVVAVAARGNDGSASVGLHEACHAVDDVLANRGSWNPRFRAMWQRVIDETDKQKPYFSPKHNPTGHDSEAFAESGAAYYRARATGKSARAAIARALGIPRKQAERLEFYWDSVSVM